MLEHRPLNVIAAEIARLWPKPSPYALPYLRAMSALGSIRDTYHYDSAQSVVLYFLSNAAGWRGPDAKRIKAELRAMT